MPPRKAERIGEATDSKTDMRLLSFLGATDVAPFFEVTPSLPLEMKANFISNFIAVRGDKQDVLADKGGRVWPHLSSPTPILQSPERRLGGA